MIAVSVITAAGTAAAAAATTTTTTRLFADMQGKLGKIFTCVGVTMWQMWRRRGLTNLYGNT